MFLEAIAPHNALYILSHFAYLVRMAPPGWAVTEFGAVPLGAGWLAAIALVALGRRRGALVAVAATMIVQALFTSWLVQADRWWPPELPYLGDAPAAFFLGAVSLVALAGSAGPRRGFELLGRWQAGLILGGLLAWTAARQYAMVWSNPETGPTMEDQHLAMVWSTIAIVVVSAAAAVVSLRSPVGRRAVLLVAPVASPFTLLWVLSRLAGVPRYASLSGALLWIVYLALALIVAGFAVGGRRRPEEAGPLAASPG